MAKNAEMTKSIRYKLHRMGEQTVLAAADEECLGKRHEGGGRVLDLQRFGSFYDGERTEVSALEPLLAKCSSANLVGEGAVGAALKKGVVQKSAVVLIGGVPHVQFYNIAER